VDDLPEEPTNPKPSSKTSPKPSLFQQIGSLLFEILETVVIAGAVFVVVYYFLVQPHQVTGSSMMPTFENGEYILTDKVSYHFSDPRRGDVIVFKSPTDPSKDFIKRIIGLPRERIELNQGFIFINGQVLDEPYLPRSTRTLGRGLLPDGQEVIVPLNQYLVLGDNRTHSSDARDFGTIPRNSIVGRVWLRYWPLNRFSLIPRQAYAVDKQEQAPR
jgi:signal peptidase I